MLRERAPAKLNLDLLVTGRRGDGYHLLDSLVVFLDLADELALVAEGPLGLEIDGPMAAGLDAGAGNLVRRAARALAAATGVEPLGKLQLTKRIPVAGGLGGGSADAAATLRLLDRHWRTRLPAAELEGLAGALGADVPVCLHGRATRMRGTGERLEPVALPPYDLVLANPGRPLATAAVFAGLDAPPSEAGRRRALLEVAASRNDLEPVARRLVPEVGRVLAALADEPGCGFSRMSGSGPTCFATFVDATAARAAAARLAARNPGWWVTAARSRGGA